MKLSSQFVSDVTQLVMEEAKAWQSRPLQKLYMIIYLDAIHFNVRIDGSIKSCATYLIYGYDGEGHKDVLGIWTTKDGEGSRYWMNVLTEIKGRGVEDILIATFDGLVGFSEAIKGIFPQTKVQRCIVHQIRNTLKYVCQKDQKEFLKDLKGVYGALNESNALDSFVSMKDRWKQYSIALNSWENNWTDLTTYYEFPLEIRKMIYTNNPIENLNRQIRKVTKNRSVFPDVDSVFKLVYLAVQDRLKRWTMPVHNWPLVFTQFSLFFKERIAI
jgi:putative transposase